MTSTTLISILTFLLRPLHSSIKIDGNIFPFVIHLLIVKGSDDYKGDYNHKLHGFKKGFSSREYIGEIPPEQPNLFILQLPETC